ncbi:hypothetical protein M9458_014591, partial [Cirrhinus mrigala]
AGLAAACHEVHDGKTLFTASQETRFDSGGETEQEAANKSTGNDDVFLHKFSGLKNKE